MTAFDKAHDQRVLRRLHNQGIELTPDDMIVQRKAAFAKLREKMRELGFEPPASDEELLQLIRDANAMHRRGYT